MKKAVLLLIVCIMISGCSAPAGGNPSYSKEDILVDLAAEMAGQIILSADPSCMEVMDAPEEVIAAAAGFAQASESDPEKAWILYADTDFTQQLIGLSAQHTEIIQLACSGILAFRSSAMLPANFEGSAIILLEYSEECRIAVVITPDRSGIASVYGYPLFSAAAEELMDQYFDNATALDAEQISDARLRCKDVSYSAGLNGHSIQADYYADLAISAFTNAECVDPLSIAEYTQDQSVTKMVITFSEALVQEPSSTAVFQFPSEVENQINDQLSFLQDAPGLQETLRRRLYLSVPNQFVANFGDNCLAANAIVQNLTHLDRLGPSAQAEEAPVLVLLGFGSEITVIASIYPGENNLYSFAYCCVPNGLEKIQSTLQRSGAILVK